MGPVMLGFFLFVVVGSGKWCSDPLGAHNKLYMHHHVLYRPRAAFYSSRVQTVSCAIQC